MRDIGVGWKQTQMDTEDLMAGILSYLVGFQFIGAWVIAVHHCPTDLRKPKLCDVVFVSNRRRVGIDDCVNDLQAVSLVNRLHERLGS